MDNLPVVRLLQIVAVIIFLLGLPHFYAPWSQIFISDYGARKEDVMLTVISTTSSVARNLYQPLILLALA